MRRSIVQITYSIVLVFLIFTCSKKNSTQNSDAPETIILFDEILFYDGYAETVDEPVPVGIYRVSNSRYVTKMTDEYIKKIGSKLNLEITVKAACDNYDRIGKVFLSLMDKGVDYNKEDVVSTVELARFITPFMDKNKSPDQVPYEFEVDNIAKILRDNALLNKYDFWFEFDIFGVPYTANKEISGCEGKNYTFFGTLKLVSSEEATNNPEQVFVSIASFESFNNYKDTDVIGQTTRSFNVEIPVATKVAKLYLITSNHGANAGGEEYNRRTHNIYFDGNLIDSYIPGGKSCEPFREYNTQANGIYGDSPRTDSEWASFSNWCPGDVIPIRAYDLGDLNAGTHTFKIEVPDAEFVDGQGDIPLSAYLQGDKL